MQNGKDLNKEELLQKAFDMLTQGSTLEHIEKKFREITSEEVVSELMVTLKKEIHLRNLKAGRLYILSGCIVMGVGFILTCLKYHASESINIVMYGFTTLGICILFVGIYKIFN